MVNWEDPIRRIGYEPVSTIVKIDLTWSLGLVSIELASIEARMALIKLEFSSCLFSDSLINLLRVSSIDYLRSDGFKMVDGHVDNEGQKVLKENRKEADCQWECRPPRSQNTKHKENCACGNTCFNSFLYHVMVVMVMIGVTKLKKVQRRKLTVNGNDTISFDKSNVEFYNCHKKGHFTRECRPSRSQDTKHKENCSCGNTCFNSFLYHVMVVMVMIGVTKLKKVQSMHSWLTHLQVQTQ
nr:hypothetical protein [Tanacetum cinerariifolium]